MDINLGILTDLGVLFALNTIISLFFVYLLVKSTVGYSKKVIAIPFIIFYMFYSLFSISNLLGYPYSTEGTIDQFALSGFRVETHGDEKRIVIWAKPTKTDKSRLYSLPYEEQLHKDLSSYVAKKRKNGTTTNEMLEIKKSMNGPSTTLKLKINQLDIKDAIPKNQQDQE